jgi:hypothetical protein
MARRVPHLHAMPATELLTVHGRHPAGVSTATFSFARGGEVIGHAVRRRFAGDRVLWHVTDRAVPPFVIEQQGATSGGWLLTRPDGAPFARIVVASTRPLEVEVLDGEHHLVRVHPDGTLARPESRARLGRIDLSAASGGGPDGTVIELPIDTDPVLRAALLTLPLCLSPVGPAGVSA